MVHQRAPKDIISPDDESLDLGNETLEPTSVLHGITIRHDIVGYEEYSILGASDSDRGSLVGTGVSGLQLAVQMENTGSVRVNLVLPCGNNGLFDMSATRQRWVAIKIAVLESVTGDRAWQAKAIVAFDEDMSKVWVFMIVWLRQ